MQKKNPYIALAFIVGFFIVLFLLCSTMDRTPRKSEIQTVSSQPTPTIDQKNDFHRQALSVVGADDGWQKPADDDIRLKRAKYLIEFLSERTKESPFDIAYATDTMSNFLENKFGRKIKRLDLLEEMKEVYSDGRAEKYGGKYSDVLGLHALIKYGN